MKKEVTKEELQKLQESVNKINGLQLQIGGVEAQKHELLHAISEATLNLVSFQKELEEQYGQVSVNISTGEIVENEFGKKD
jgi:conjugal transfer/entry exclusion protein